MAENADTAPVETGTEDTTDTAEPQHDDGLADAGKKALAAERSARRAAEKATAELGKRLKEFEDRDKSEVQKAAERAENAEKALAERDREALRLRVAMKHNLPSEVADRLRGDDEDAMTEDAQQLAALLKPAGPQRGSAGQGPRGSNTSPQDTPATAFARLFGG